MDHFKLKEVIRYYNNARIKLIQKVKSPVHTGLFTFCTTFMNPSNFLGSDQILSGSIVCFRDFLFPCQGNICMYLRSIHHKQPRHIQRWREDAFGEWKMSTCG